MTILLLYIHLTIMIMIMMSLGSDHCGGSMVTVPGLCSGKPDDCNCDAVLATATRCMSRLLTRLRPAHSALSTERSNVV